jgi:peptidoglycan/LPS O-acetylase OafA/YrhL
MKERTAALMTLFGFLLMFGAVGGMEDPSKEAYFLEQCLVALVGIGLAFCGTLGLNNSQYYDER